MNKKTLPVSYPIITGDQNVSAPILAILQNYEAVFPWICCNYIQLKYVKKNNSITINMNNGILEKWSNIPFFHYQQIDKFLIEKKWKSITEFILELIAEDSYIYLILDLFYVSTAINYQKKHFIHPVLIYGYDKELQQFYAADFLFEKSRKFSFNTITFDELKRAYNIRHPEIENKHENKMIAEFIISVKIKIWKRAIKYKKRFNVSQIKLQLEDYLNSRSSFLTNYYNMENETYFGLKIYEIFKQDAKMFFQYGDMRSLVFFEAHKIMMLFRLEKLFLNGNLKNYDSIKQYLFEVKEKATMLKLLYIKYQYKNDSGILDNAIEYLNSMEKNEVIGIKKIIKNLIS